MSTTSSSRCSGARKALGGGRRELIEQRDARVVARVVAPHGVIDVDLLLARVLPERLDFFLNSLDNTGPLVAQEVEEEWQHSKDGPATLTQVEFDRVAQYFVPPAYEKLADTDASYEKHLLEDKAFARWVSRSVHGHKVPGYAAVTLSTKPGVASPPGDATDAQMEAVADLASLDVYLPRWQVRVLGDSVRMAESIRSKYGGVVLDIAWALFEIRMYREPTRDPNLVWADITSR